MSSWTIFWTCQTSTWVLSNTICALNSWLCSAVQEPHCDIKQLLSYYHCLHRMYTGNQMPRLRQVEWTLSSHVLQPSWFCYPMFVIRCLWSVPSSSLIYTLHIDDVSIYTSYILFSTIVQFIQHICIQSILTLFIARCVFKIMSIITQRSIFC